MSTFNKYRTKGAYHYDWYETEDWYKYLIDRAVKFCNGLTLDLGCGDGVLVNKIAEKGHEAIGIDLDKDGIMLARQRQVNGADFLTADIYKTELVLRHANTTNELKYVSSINVIEHLDEPQVLLNYVHLAKKGAIIATIDWQGGAFGEDHRKEYTLDELVEFFKEFNPKPFRYKDTEWIGVEITK